MKVKRIKGHGGLNIAADVGGDPSAPPIVLLHGGGQTRFAWKNAARELINSGFHVISMDLRGHGESDWSPEGEYNTDAYVGDLKAVIATLDQPPCLVGASLGGVTSLILTGESPPSAVRALVLVDIVPQINERGAERIGAFMRANPNGFASIDEAADVVSAYLPHRPRPKDVTGLKKNLRLGEDGRYYWHWDPNMFTGRSRDNIVHYERLKAAARNVRVPTLLVRGALSEVVAPEGVTEFRALVPHAEYVDIADADHMVAGDRNDMFNEAVISFLKRAIKRA